VFKLANIALVISGHQLSRVLGLDRHLPLEKVDEAQSLLLVHEIEIHSILEGLKRVAVREEAGEEEEEMTDCDLKTVRVGIVLQQDLLEIEEGSLVWDMLAYLHHGMPHTLSIKGLTSFALLISNHKLDDLCLLENGSVHDLLLDRQLDLQSQRVRFSPDPHSINNFYF
jgi:hypothetical protein